MANNDWQQFLIQQGYSLSDNSQLVNENMPQDGQSCIYDLSSLAVLTCTGEDVQTFLQGQLSNDINQLTAMGEMHLSAYCTPKGRMLALFTVIKCKDDGYYLVAPQAVITKVKNRLQMFVMRAKVSIVKDEDAIILGAKIDQTGTNSDTTVQQFTSFSFAAIPNTRHRYLTVLPSIEAIEAFKSLTRFCSYADYLHWQTLNIAEGLPQIDIELAEELIPQSINLDLIDGVNFKKGCYPGQEIIARVKYRGKPKTRMLSVSIASAAHPQVGAPVFIDGRTQSAGIVISVGANIDDTTAVLITTPVSKLATGHHYLGATDGEEFTRCNPPYPILI